MPSEQDYLDNLTIENFCWRCGKYTPGRLFCSEKHKQQYVGIQEQQIKKGKKAGYGAAGSTH